MSRLREMLTALGFAFLIVTGGFLIMLLGMAMKDGRERSP